MRAVISVPVRIGCNRVRHQWSIHIHDGILIMNGFAAIGNDHEEESRVDNTLKIVYN